MAAMIYIFATAFHILLIVQGYHRRQFRSQYRRTVNGNRPFLLRRLQMTDERQNRDSETSKNLLELNLKKLLRDAKQLRNEAMSIEGITSKNESTGTSIQGKDFISERRLEEYQATLNNKTNIISLFASSEEVKKPPVMPRNMAESSNRDLIRKITGDKTRDSVYSSQIDNNSSSSNSTEDFSPKLFYKIKNNYREPFNSTGKSVIYENDNMILIGVDKCDIDEEQLQLRFMAYKNDFQDVDFPWIFSQIFKNLFSFIADSTNSQGINISYMLKLGYIHVVSQIHIIMHYIS